MKSKILNIIDFLSKTLRTDLRYIISGIFWFGSEHFVTTLTGLATAVVFANLIVPETYGTYKYVLSLLPFLGITTLSKINDSLTVSVAKGFEGDIINALKTKIKWGLLGSMAGFILSLYYYTRGNQELAILISIMAIFIPVFNNPLIYSNFLTGKKKFKPLAILHSISSVIYSILIIGTIILSKNVIIIITVYFLTNTIIRFSALIYTLKKYPPNKNTEEKTIPYGKKISILEVVNVISASIDNILVFHYLGAVELAAYVFIKKVPDNLKFFPRFITTLTVPKFSKRDIGSPTIKKEVRRKTIFYVLGVTGIITAYIVAAPWIFKILFAPYQEYVFLSQIYAFSYIVNFGGLFLSFVETNRKTKSVLSMHLITSVMTTLIIFVSIKYYGLIGLVIGYSVVRFSASSVRALFFQKATK